MEAEDMIKLFTDNAAGTMTREEFKAIQNIEMDV